MDFSHEAVSILKSTPLSYKQFYKILSSSINTRLFSSLLLKLKRFKHLESILFLQAHSLRLQDK